VTRVRLVLSYYIYKVTEKTTTSFCNSTVIFDKYVNYPIRNTNSPTNKQFWQKLFQFFNNCYQIMNGEILGNGEHLPVSGLNLCISFDLQIWWDYCLLYAVSLYQCNLKRGGLVRHKTNVLNWSAASLNDIKMIF